MSRDSSICCSDPKTASVPILICCNQPPAKDQWDEALQALWAEYSKEKLDTGTFLCATKDILPLVMNAAHLSTIEAAEGMWEQHHKELEALVTESGIGEKLFCGAVDAWKSERVQTCVADLLSKMPAALSEVEVKKLFSTLATLTGSMDKSLFARTRVTSFGLQGLVAGDRSGQHFR